MKGKIASDCRRCVRFLVCKHTNEFIDDATKICNEISWFDVSYPTLTLSISCENFMGAEALLGPICEELKR